jgi:hypothetical protein
MSSYFQVGKLFKASANDWHHERSSYKKNDIIIVIKTLQTGWILCLNLKKLHQFETTLYTLREDFQ